MAAVGNVCHTTIRLNCMGCLTTRPETTKEDNLCDLLPLERERWILDKSVKWRLQKRPRWTVWRDYVSWQILRQFRLPAREIICSWERHIAKSKYPQMSFLLVRIVLHGYYRGTISGVKKLKAGKENKKRFPLSLAAQVRQFESSHFKKNNKFF